MLQKHVNNLKDMCDSKLDDLEQYGRRQCLRIDGVAFKEGERPSEVLTKVKELLVKSESVIPDDCLDRAHRIGKPYKDRTSGIRNQSIIVKFTNFRYRTLFYQNRKKLNGKTRVKLDLTKRRYSLL